MPKCPYCGRPIDRKLEHVDMSKKKREILELLMAAGHGGASVEDLKKSHFADAQSDVTLRTTIHYINKLIKPNRILRRDGIIKVVCKD